MINLKPIRGMHDRLPDECEHMSYIMSVIRSVVESYGYKQVVLPIVETTELFKRSVGVSSDIVQKEMYTFKDRNDESLTLRPEGTAGCFRAYLSEFHRSSPYQRLWYFGPMYRRERPQKGRQREFYQFGIEAFGYHHPSIDVEVVKIAYTIFNQLSLSSPVVCKLNYLGASETRETYLNVLREYFSPFVENFDEVHQYRFEQNVLRLLDSKDEYVKSLIKNAPKITDYLSEKELIEYSYIKDMFIKNEIPFEEDHTLVRGLDYYSGLIYEWQALEGLGAQNTICAGGRTDKLCEILSNKQGFSLGMAIGIERLAMLVNHSHYRKKETIFLFTDNEDNNHELFKLQVVINENQLNSFIHFGVSQLKKQLNRASKMGHTLAIGLIEGVWYLFNIESNEKYSFHSISEVMEKIHACKS